MPAGGNDALLQGGTCLAQQPVENVVCLRLRENEIESLSCSIGLLDVATEILGQAAVLAKFGKLAHVRRTCVCMGVGMSLGSLEQFSEKTAPGYGRELRIPADFSDSKADKVGNLDKGLFGKIR